MQSTMLKCCETASSSRVAKWKENGGFIHVICVCKILAILLLQLKYPLLTAKERKKVKRRLCNFDLLDNRKWTLKSVLIVNLFTDYSPLGEMFHLSSSKSLRAQESEKVLVQLWSSEQSKVNLKNEEEKIRFVIVI